MPWGLEPTYERIRRKDQTRDSGIKPEVTQADYALTLRQHKRLSHKAKGQRCIRAAWKYSGSEIFRKLNAQNDKNGEK